MKTCSKCGVGKEETGFFKTTQNPDGFDYWCKACRAEHKRVKYASDPRLRDGLSASRKQKRREGGESLRQYFRERVRRQRLDPQFRLLCSLRTRVSKTVRGRGTGSPRTLQLLGCSVEQLREHLEARFGPGMSWESYGLFWEIDHIRPCASFDLTDPLQQRACFHFTNLQPLTCFDNASKGAKVA